MTQLFHLHNEMTNELRKKRRRKRKPLINFTVVFFVTRHVLVIVLSLFWNHNTRALTHSFFFSFVSDDCRMGNGRYYMGQINVTKSGIPCQKWDSQKPHQHIQPPNVFPQVQNAENYCRNAGGEEPSPWCYTMNESVRWQLCDIPLCRK